MVKEGKMSTVPFTEKDVKAYLDECIVFWRKKRDNPSIEDRLRISMAEHYVDAFQSVRMSLFGELLLTEEQRDELEKALENTLAGQVKKLRKAFANLVEAIKNTVKKE